MTAGSQHLVNKIKPTYVTTLIDGNTTQNCNQSTLFEVAASNKIMVYNRYITLHAGTLYLSLHYYYIM